MKRVIKSSFPDDDEMFIPDEFDLDFAEDVVSRIKDAIRDKYGRRLKRLQIDVDDIAAQGHKMQAEFIVYNSDVVKADKLFKFVAYDDYWEEDDFDQHLSRSIVEFVENLV